MDLRFVTLGPLRLEAYGVCFSMACLVAWLVFRRELRRGGLASGWSTLAVWVCVPAGVLGARAVASVPGLVTGESTVLGGWAAGITLLALFVRVAGVSVRRVLDALAPGLCLAQAIGRLGCFCAGHCYGVSTMAPWGVTYPRGAPPVHEPVHPVPLYAALVLAVAGALALRWRPERSGLRAAAVGGFLLLQRAGFDALRPEPRHGGLTLGQWLAVAAAAFMLTVVAANRARISRLGRG